MNLGFILSTYTKQNRPGFNKSNQKNQSNVLLQSVLSFLSLLFDDSYERCYSDKV